NLQTSSTLFKRIDQIHYLTQRDLMLYRYFAKLTRLVWIALQCCYQLFHHIIDIDERHVHRTVVYLYGKIMSHVVTESRYSAVVIGTTPFTKHIRETVYQHIRACLTTVFKQ